MSILSILFDPFRIKNLEIRNWFVRSVTTNLLANKDGEVSDVQIKFYSDLAHGGVGLIITGAMDVQREGRICQRFVTPLQGMSILMA